MPLSSVKICPKVGLSKTMTVAPAEDAVAVVVSVAVIGVVLDMLPVAVMAAVLEVVPVEVIVCVVVIAAAATGVSVGAAAAGAGAWTGIQAARNNVKPSDRGKPRRKTERRGVRLAKLTILFSFSCTIIQ